MNNNRLQKLLEFIKQEPDDPFLKYALAIEYLKLDDQETALSYFEDLVSSHPDYTGTYYHLGKLYETLGRKDDAVKTYRDGMQHAKKARDNHAFAELQSVYNSLMDLDHEDD